MNAALAVTRARETRARMEAGDLTLAEAAIFAEFEADESALERLERRRCWDSPSSTKRSGCATRLPSGLPTTPW